MYYFLLSAVNFVHFVGNLTSFKRDYVYMHDLPDAKTVMELLPLWFEDYNIHHPHKGLKMRSPREYRKKENKLEGVRFDGGTPSGNKIEIISKIKSQKVYLLAHSYTQDN